MGNITRPAPGWDSQLFSVVVKVTENWIVSVTPMIFNDRITLTALDQYPYEYTAGFCYNKGAAAFLAAMAWDPEQGGNPLGYTKVACDSRGPQ